MQRTTPATAAATLSPPVAAPPHLGRQQSLNVRPTPNTEVRPQRSTSASRPNLGQREPIWARSTFTRPAVPTARGTSPAPPVRPGPLRSQATNTSQQSRYLRSSAFLSASEAHGSFQTSSARSSGSTNRIWGAVQPMEPRGAHSSRVSPSSDRSANQVAPEPVINGVRSKHL